MNAKKGITPAKAALAGALTFFCVAVGIAVVAIIIDREEKREHRAYLEHAKASRAKAAAKEQAIEEAKAREEAKIGGEEARKKWREENKPLAVGPLSLAASTLSIGMKTTQVQAILGAVPLGECRSSEGARVYIWDNGPTHTPVQVTMRNGRVTGWDEGRLDSAATRKIILESHLEGKCSDKDPK